MGPALGSLVIEPSLKKCHLNRGLGVHKVPAMSRARGGTLQALGTSSAWAMRLKNALGKKKRMPWVF